MSNKTKFALTPGLTPDKPINYSTTWGLKQWTESTKKLSDTLYDGIQQNLKMFLEIGIESHHGKMENHHQSRWK